MMKGAGNGLRWQVESYLFVGLFPSSYLFLLWIGGSGKSSSRVRAEDFGAENLAVGKDFDQD
jgi:hypothetical protein